MDTSTKPLQEQEHLQIFNCFALFHYTDIGIVL